MIRYFSGRHISDLIHTRLYWSRALRISKAFRLLGSGASSSSLSGIKTIIQSSFWTILLLLHFYGSPFTLFLDLILKFFSALYSPSVNLSVPSHRLSSICTMIIPINDLVYLPINTNGTSLDLLHDRFSRMVRKGLEVPFNPPFRATIRILHGLEHYHFQRAYLRWRFLCTLSFPILSRTSRTWVICAFRPIIFMTCLWHIHRRH